MLCCPHCSMISTVLNKLLSPHSGVTVLDNIELLRIELRRNYYGGSMVCVAAHVPLRMLPVQVLASQLHFLDNSNAELAAPPLFWATDMH